jgi:uncharacterized membrane protein
MIGRAALVGSEYGCGCVSPRKYLMMFFLLALLIGIVAGLRAFTAPAAASWAGWLGWLPLGGTWLAFLGSIWTAVILTVLALVELVNDQLPSTPSRKVPVMFGGRIVMGALAGTAFGYTGGSFVTGAIAGAVGAVIGTLAGHEGRARLAAAFSSDRSVALIEDAVAIIGALVIVLLAR